MKFLTKIYLYYKKGENDKKIKTFLISVEIQIRISIESK